MEVLVTVCLAIEFAEVQVLAWMCRRRGNSSSGIIGHPRVVVC